MEGLARGADTRDSPPAFRATLNPEHVARVAENAKAALAFARSRNPAIRCLTTRGTVLTSSTFTDEEDVTQVRKAYLFNYTILYLSIRVDFFSQFHFDFYLIKIFNFYSGSTTRNKR